MQLTQPKILLKPGDVFNGYRIEEELYEHDGPIQCYFAIDLRRHESVKLQCVDSRPGENTPERIERFHATAARLRGLRDQYLTSFYDGGVTERIYWAASEVMAPDLQTLESRLALPEQRLPLIMCLFLAQQIALALETAHKAGVKHLRLRPDKILVAPQLGGLVKVLDVGIAELFSLTPAFLRAAPLYVAPEQLRDRGKPADERADIYALGMVLYALLAWDHPYADKEGTLPGIDRQLFNAMTRTPPLLGSRVKPFPEFLDVYVQSLVAKARSNRPRTWSRVREGLDDIASRVGVWIEAVNSISELPLAEKQRLIEQLRGPLAEGAELLTALEDVLGTMPGSVAAKRKEPKSGTRPSAALRAGMEGYLLSDGAAEESGKPEPEWLANLPDEPEDAEAAEATEAPRASAEPGTPPPKAERCPALVSDAPQEGSGAPALEQGAPVAAAHDGGPPSPSSPVTLPSGCPAPQAISKSRGKRSSHASFTVAALFAVTLFALLVIRDPRRAPATVARSVALRAPELRLDSAVVPPIPADPIPADPSARALALGAPALAPSATPRRALPQGAPTPLKRPITAPSASVAEPPASVGEGGDDSCASYHCRNRQPVLGSMDEGRGSGGKE
jgi:serine/threonine-protein kinase